MCLDAPHIVRAPTKGVLDGLCRRGLGSKWFTTDDRFTVNVDTTAEEFDFAVQCLFPPIRSIPYEFCKTTGPGNVVLVPLPISDDNMKPKRDKSFKPFFSVSELKEMIGRKGKLYIRPLRLIHFRDSPRLTEHEVCW